MNPISISAPAFAGGQSISQPSSADNPSFSNFDQLLNADSVSNEVQSALDSAKNSILKELNAAAPLSSNAAVPNNNAIPVLDSAPSGDSAAWISDSKHLSYDPIISEMSKKYNVPTNLIYSVIKAESDFDPSSVSSTGAMGLMQLMPDTAAGLGVTNAFDPAQNIEGGTKYLSQMIKQFNGNLKYAVAAYNAGPNNVVKYNGIPPFGETQSYVKKVLGGLDSVGSGN